MELDRGTDIQHLIKWVFLWRYNSATETKKIATYHIHRTCELTHVKTCCTVNVNDYLIVDKQYKIYVFFWGMKGRGLIMIRNFKFEFGFFNDKSYQMKVCC